MLKPVQAQQAAPQSESSVTPRQLVQAQFARYGVGLGDAASAPTAEGEPSATSASTGPSYPIEAARYLPAPPPGPAKPSQLRSGLVFLATLGGAAAGAYFFGRDDAHRAVIGAGVGAGAVAGVNNMVLAGRASTDNERATALCLGVAFLCAAGYGGYALLKRNSGAEDDAAEDAEEAE